MPMPVPGPGRPLSVTQAHIDTARELSRTGLSLSGISGALGVTPRSVQRWCFVGKEAAEREEAGEELPETDALLAAFFRAIAQGLSDAEARFIGGLAESSSGGSQFWLERRLSSEYAKYRDRPDVVDREARAAEQAAAPVVDQAAVLASLPTEVLEELLAARKRTE